MLPLVSHNPCYFPWVGTVKMIEVVPPALRNTHSIKTLLRTFPMYVLYDIQIADNQIALILGIEI